MTWFTKTISELLASRSIRPSGCFLPVRNVAQAKLCLLYPLRDSWCIHLFGAGTAVDGDPECQQAAGEVYFRNSLCARSHPALFQDYVANYTNYQRCRGDTKTCKWFAQLFGEPWCKSFTVPPDLGPG